MIADFTFGEQKTDTTEPLSPTPHISPKKDVFTFDCDIVHHRRPRLNILDSLTIELPTKRGEARRYRCAGEGCSKRYKPRLRVSVLMHAKVCLKLSVDERKMAAAASAKTALVAETHLSSSPISSPSIRSGE